MSLPNVSIIVTAYSPKSKPYLDLCIQSIRNLNYHPSLLEVIIVAPSVYAPEYAAVKTISPPEDIYGCPRGLNYGIEHATGEYVFVLNDDVIVTRDSLLNLVNSLDPAIGLLMPIGNDMQMRYYADLPMAGPYTLEQIVNVEDMLHFRSPYPRALLFHDTLCIYAYLMRKDVHERVGGFDEKLICADDIDYCMRLRHLGYLNAITMNAVVWHAGGVTSKDTFTDEMRVRGNELFHAKWAGV